MTIDTLKNQYTVFWSSDCKFMISALSLSKIKPQNLHDWGSQSAIDPINPLVYIQAYYLEFKIGTKLYNIYNTEYKTNAYYFFR